MPFCQSTDSCKRKWYSVMFLLKGSTREIQEAPYLPASHPTNQPGGFIYCISLKGQPSVFAAVKYCTYSSLGLFPRDVNLSHCDLDLSRLQLDRKEITQDFNLDLEVKDSANGIVMTGWRNCQSSSLQCYLMFCGSDWIIIIMSVPVSCQVKKIQRFLTDYNTKPCLWGMMLANDTIWFVTLLGHWVSNYDMCITGGLWRLLECVVVQFMNIRRSMFCYKLKCDSEIVSWGKIKMFPKQCDCDHKQQIWCRAVQTRTPNPSH